ncbi:MAG: hypothetical protein AAGG01_18905 [Planctomycetota bacterium]
MSITLLTSSLFALSATAAVPAALPAPLAPNSITSEGAVYAMTNDFTGNSVVAYDRASDGTLTLIGEFATGGLGAAFDGGEGLDPLISAYALLLTDNNDFLLAVNAGSDTVTAFRVNDDHSLTRTGRARSGGVGPNSIAYRNGFVVVSNVDADGVFNGEPDQEGSLRTFRLTPEGRLIAVPLSRRVLENRPSAVQFTPDGSHIVVASINAGSQALSSQSEDELVVFEIDGVGRPSRFPTGRGASTLRDNAENRNLASAIGFEILEQEGREFVVVTEAREFQADGSPPAFPALQTGSVSTWELLPNGSLDPIMLDVLAGTDFFDGQRTACWIEFSQDERTFWVSNALEATLSSYSFDNGVISLIEEVSAEGNGAEPTNPFGTTDGWIDMWISADGRFLYQLYGLDGTIGVFGVRGAELTLLQTVSDLPVENTQGIVAF